MRVNTSSTGQGAEIVKSVVALIPLLATFAFEGAGPNVADIQKACSFLQSIGDKPVTLTYTAVLDFARPDPYSPQLTMDMASKTIFKRIKNAIPAVCVLAQGHKTKTPLPFLPTAGGVWSDSAYVLLPLRQPNTAIIKVYAGPKPCSGESFWEARVQVPQTGTDYDLPIPTPPVLGKQTFTLGLSEAGAVTKLGYGTDTGVTSGLTAATSIATAAKPQTPAEKAAELKAQADLIAQQERLVRCQADPKACT